MSKDVSEVKKPTTLTSQQVLTAVVRADELLVTDPAGLFQPVATIYPDIEGPDDMAIEFEDGVTLDLSEFEGATADLEDNRIRLKSGYVFILSSKAPAPVKELIE